MLATLPAGFWPATVFFPIECWIKVYKPDRQRRMWLRVRGDVGGWSVAGRRGMCVGLRRERGQTGPRAGGAAAQPRSLAAAPVPGMTRSRLARWMQALSFGCLIVTLGATVGSVQLIVVDSQDYTIFSN